MEAEVEAYHRDYKCKILSLLSLSGVWTENCQQSKIIRLILLWSTITAEVAFLYTLCNFSLVNSDEVGVVISAFGTLNSLIFFLAKKAICSFDNQFSTMDDVVQAYYQNYKNVIVSFLLVSGMWPDDSKQPKFLRTILGSLALFVLLILILGVLNFTIHNSRNIMAVIGGSGSIISFDSVIVKIVAMMLLWRDVKSLSGGLSALFESDLKVREYRVHLLSYYRSFYRFFKAHYFYCLGLVVLSASIPVISAFHGRFVRTHAIRVPFSYTPGGTLHWIIFAFEITSTAYMAINSIGVDTVFGLFSLQMVGELRLLAHRFRSLKPGENYRRELKDCIDRHCRLIDYRYMMDKVFGFISAWLALSCAIIICSLIFQITQSKHVTLFQIFFAVDYTTAKLLQAYTFSWFGNTITVESEKCVKAIYYCGWAETGDSRIMNDVLIIQSQSPLYINAMGVMIVQLDMFIKIAHASISYFFLLKTIEEKLAWAS